jgi:predicted nucleic acid-binding protein
VGRLEEKPSPQRLPMHPLLGTLRAVRLYLNTSALNRPFDDRSLPRVRFEAEAVRNLVAKLEAGKAQLVSSEYLMFEVRQTPDADRLHRVMRMLRLATVVVIASPEVITRAKAIEAFGFRGLDALHIASAEAGNADALVTCDDRMLRRARRAGRELQIEVVTPIEALAKLAARGST